MLLNELNSFFFQFQEFFTTTEHIFVEGCINSLTRGGELTQSELKRLTEITEKLRRNQQIEETLFGTEQ